MAEPGWPRGDRPPHVTVWELWKTGRIMSCEINEHPLGWEIRSYVGAEFRHSRVSGTRAEALEEAERQRRDMIELGWTGRPPMPE
jgi:hypothetical protein